jgi:hypothetical protein
MIAFVNVARLSAATFVAYAAVVALSVLAPGVPPEWPWGWVDFISRAARLIVALALAGALLFVGTPASHWAFAFAAWFGAFGALSLFGQLYQRFIPDGSGNYILINWPHFSLVVASEAALLLVLVAWRPSKGRTGAVPGASHSS